MMGESSWGKKSYSLWSDLRSVALKIMYLVSPTLNVNQELYAISMFLEKLGIYKLIMLQVIVTCYVVFPSKFQSSMTNFHYENVTMQHTPSLKVDEPKVSQDDNTRKLMSKKCHSIRKVIKNDIKHQNYHPKKKQGLVYIHILIDRLIPAAHSPAHHSRSPTSGAHYSLT